MEENKMEENKTPLCDCHTYDIFVELLRRKEQEDESEKAEYESQVEDEVSEIIKKHTNKAKAPQ